MTRDDIIRMAEQAGFVIDKESRKYQPNCISATHHVIDEPLTRFATLVAAAEREACAQVVERMHEANEAFAKRQEWWNDRMFEMEAELQRYKKSAAMWRNKAYEAAGHPLPWKPDELWQGLTDEEIERACVPLGAAMLSFTEVARAIEAKLKEKNT